MCRVFFSSPLKACFHKGLGIIKPGMSEANQGFFIVKHPEKDREAGG
jgi:hypothetical protein